MILQVKALVQHKYLLLIWGILIGIGSAYSRENAPTLPAAGTLLTFEKGGGKPLSAAAENYLVTYVSNSVNGTLTTVSGQIAIPSTPLPLGGYPVINWAQGTTGLGSRCAPSDSPSEPILNEWVKRGYAVVRTDYEGWDKLGSRPLLNQRSNAAAVVNMIIAAHQLSDKLSRNWIVIGHSEGGGTTLWTAALGENAANSYSLKGGIAIAPVGPGVLNMMKILKDGKPIASEFPLAEPELVATLAAMTVRGAKNTDSTIQLDDIVYPQFRAWVDAVASVCFDLPVDLVVPDVGQYLKPGGSYDKLVAFLQAQDASSQTIHIPVMIVQAANDDLTTTPKSTLQMIHNLCVNGSNWVSLRTYIGQDHQGVILASLNDNLTFIDNVLAGRPVPSDACALK